MFGRPPWGILPRGPRGPTKGTQRVRAADPPPTQAKKPPFFPEPLPTPPILSPPLAGPTGELRNILQLLVISLWLR